MIAPLWAPAEQAWAATSVATKQRIKRQRPVQNPNIFIDYFRPQKGSRFNMSADDAKGNVAIGQLGM